MNLTKYLLGALVLLVLSGCAKDNFGCAQFPETGCAPVSEIYDETNNGVVDYRKTLYKNKEQSSSHETRHSTDIVVSKSHQAINHVVSGDPILTKPRVLRILFNSWEDAENDLVAGGYVFVKVEDSQWVITNNQDS
jgi:type IV conjugative transfer system lipoprotein TraV